MMLEKIKYSKCPACQKYGIRAFFKSGRYTYKLTCKYCAKKFKINIVLNTFINIFIAILVGWIAFVVDKYIISMPLWFWLGIAIVLLLGFEYFAPLEEVE